MNFFTKNRLSVQYKQLISAVLVGTLLSSCMDTKKVAELQSHVSNLESQLKKEKQDNAEMSSFRFNLESQLKQKNELYAKCQEDTKGTLDLLGKKYNNLVAEHNKLKEDYTLLNGAYETSKQSVENLLEEINKEGKAVLAAPAKRKVVARSKRRHSAPAKKSRGRKRRR